MGGGGGGGGGRKGEKEGGLYLWQSPGYWCTDHLYGTLAPGSLSFLLPSLSLSLSLFPNLLLSLSLFFLPSSPTPPPPPPSPPLSHYETLHTFTTQWGLKRRKEREGERKEGKVGRGKERRKRVVCSNNMSFAWCRDGL